MEVYLRPSEDCFDERYQLPHELPITYRGYELCEAKLNKQNNIYVFDYHYNEVTVLKESEFLIMPNDLMMTSFEIKIDTVGLGSKFPKVEDIPLDTFKLYFTDSVVVGKEIDAFIKGIKQIADTIR